MFPTSVEIAQTLIRTSNNGLYALAIAIAFFIPALVFGRFLFGRKSNETGGDLSNSLDLIDADREMREKRRKQAWEMYSQGIPQAEIAKELGVTRGAVSQWVKAARENGGADALVSRPRPGRPNLLTDEQLAELRQMLQSDPANFGLSGQRWTYAKIAELIEKEYGVSYHPAHVSRLMKKFEEE